MSNVTTPYCAPGEAREELHDQLAAVLFKPLPPYSDSVGVLAVFQIRMDPHSFCRALRDEFVSASGFDLKPVLIN